MAKITLFKNSQWRVNRFGDLICDQYDYQISKSTLLSTDWESQLREKRWCNMALFRQAFKIAIQNTTDHVEK